MAVNVRLLIKAALLLLLLVAGTLVWWRLDVPIRDVTVSGPLSEAEIDQVSGVVRDQLHGGLLSVDIGELARATGQLAWIRDVTVRRVWPDRLQVEVVKATPIARWNRDRYLTSTGGVIDSPDVIGGLPELECELASPMEAVGMFRVLGELAAAEDLHPVALHQDRIGEWQIYFANDLRVALGADDVVARMHRFLRSWHHRSAVGESMIAYVDTRYPEGVAIGFREMVANNTVVSE
ncbi:MAG: FtsQ-type POTRA domain-containing protein [Pseudomonadales bacterium]|nr:FtsQ-type POTRA domain-containing protein [Pseudomonadales bacterium]MCP5185350.1 FtsQ-type POTRA domain-containing protein [Pseudomonadales bacterium]